MQKMAPLWLNYTENVRLDPLAFNETGAEALGEAPGGRPWIADM